MKIAFEGVADLFGADLSPAGQLLGQLGEARDVDEGYGAFDGSMASVRSLAEPVHDEPRNVRLEALPGGDVATHLRRGHR